ncbi:MAG: hypothetical protein ACK2U0_20465 [Candidatus Promineifilaceae bacterium]|jgi:hypothetical protein
MEQLPPQLLPAVPHIIFGIFDLAIPDLIAWIMIIVLFFIAAWARLPKFFEPAS